VVDFFRKELAAGRENNLRKRILRYRTNPWPIFVRLRIAWRVHSMSLYPATTRCRYPRLYRLKARTPADVERVFMRLRW